LKTPGEDGADLTGSTGITTFIGEVLASLHTFGSLPPLRAARAVTRIYRFSLVGVITTFVATMLIPALPLRRTADRELRRQSAIE
jgi:hypothetical protein